MGKTDFVITGAAEVLRITKMAILFDFEGSGEAWVPMSACSVSTLSQARQSAVLDCARVERGFAEKKGIEFL